MSANIPAQGPAVQLDGRAAPDESISPEDVKDADRVSRLLSRITRDLARIAQLWRPRRLDFEGRAYLGDGTTVYRLEHRFGGAVRITAVNWDSGGTGAFDYSLDASSNLNTAAFVTHVAGTGTIRIEEAG